MSATDDGELEFKTTYLSERGIRVLATHALGLPQASPVRQTIKLLIERWAQGSTHTFKRVGS